MSERGGTTNDAAAPWLSICIPTYNFASYIGETLDSIARQDLSGVEVIILDGGSTDDTPTVVARFASRFPRLDYIRREQRGGIDRDLEFAVAACRGEYVWTFSADDIMVDGAVAQLAARIGGGEDIILCETVLCDLALRNPRPYRNLRDRREQTFRLLHQPEITAYLKQAVNTQAVFSFCGANIFRRSRWNSSPYDGSFLGSCWSHAARLLAHLPGGLSVRHVPLAWSLKRGDNDSFAERGIVHRVGIAVDGYLRLAEVYLAGVGDARRQVARLLRAEYTLRTMLAQKALLHRTGRGADIARLLELYAAITAGAGARPWIGYWILRLTPALLLDMARSLKRMRASRPVPS
ncbi:MAG TPA: glycosyltransferase family 2 protein [Planctomycetota bacterium]|nr:glycosyltransferase family 2 protein [Planctomycetota bacterium]